MSESEGWTKKDQPQEPLTRKESPMTRTHDLAGTNGFGVATVREHSRAAMEIGHWRRLLAIYGDHHALCNVRSADDARTCDCGWDEVFHVSVTALAGTRTATAKSNALPSAGDA